MPRNQHRKGSSRSGANRNVQGGDRSGTSAGRQSSRNMDRGGRK